MRLQTDNKATKQTKDLQTLNSMANRVVNQQGIDEIGGNVNNKTDDENPDKDGIGEASNDSLTRLSKDAAREGDKYHLPERWTATNKVATAWMTIASGQSSLNQKAENACLDPLWGLPPLQRASQGLPPPWFIPRACWPKLPDRLLDFTQLFG